jgi:hypothetical protein
MDVAIGVDAHKATLEVAALDAVGRLLSGRRFSNDPTGHRGLQSWITSLGEGAWSESSVRAPLERHLQGTFSLPAETSERFRGT